MTEQKQEESGITFKMADKIQIEETRMSATFEQIQGEKLVVKDDKNENDKKRLSQSSVEGDEHDTNEKMDETVENLIK